MSTSKKIAKAVMVAMIGVGVAGVTTSTLAGSKPKMEKCYGIVKAHKNDCGTKKHACAGQATKNSDPAEWMYVLKGNCEKIVGGSLTKPKS